MQVALNAAILAAVVAALRETCCTSDAEITQGTRLAEDLGLDSLDTWQMALCLEEEFDLEFSSDAVARFATVSDVVAYVSHRYFRDVEDVEPRAADLRSPTRPARAGRPVAGTLTR